MKWRPLWENRLACFSLKLSKSTVWFSRIRSPLYMGARAGQLDAGFEARLFFRAALFLCLYTPSFLIWIQLSQQSVVIPSLSGRRTDRQIETEVEMKERERERERERGCPAMLLVVFHSLPRSSILAEVTLFRELGLTSTACLMLYMTS